MVFERFRRMMGGDDGSSSEFVEIDLENERAESKVFVKTFVLKDYDDVTPILNSLREGYTIVVIDIKPLKARDVIELKRAISKVKKTVEALDGKIAGFGENTVIATPSKVFDIQRGGVEEKEVLRADEIERF